MQHISKNDTKPEFQALDASTFASVMGQAVWLMTMSKAHRDLPIHAIEKRVAPAIFLKQFKLYSKGKQPIAFLTWASVSPAISNEIEGGRVEFDLADWRSGKEIKVIDCVAPFNPSETFIEKFLSDVKIAHEKVE